MRIGIGKDAKKGISIAFAVLISIVLIMLLFLWIDDTEAKSEKAQKIGAKMEPKNNYLITAHYDLGMHCTGFDFSYCCVLPLYNSVLAQVIKAADEKNPIPKLLSEEDLKKEGLVLWYEHENNTYSEGSKLIYWNVPYDVDGDGKLTSPNDSFANGEFSHLFTYGESPLGFKPEGAKKRLYVGKDINIPVDHGPTGKPLSNSTLDYTGKTGTVVYSTLNDGKSEIPLTLSQRDYWEALGLPLTPFFDKSIGTLREVTEEVIRPYQIAKVTLAKWNDASGDGKVQKGEINPIANKDGKPVSFIATNPIDVPACDRCHGTERANKKEFTLWKKEYDYWKSFYPDASDYYSRIKAAAISILEVHDRRSGTDFLSNYNPSDTTGASINRLGRTSIKCQECHADNIVGVLKSGVDPKTGRVVSALTKAVHLRHLKVESQPDTNRRSANCQTCHPAHDQSGSLARFPLDEHGNFKGGDIRDKWGGCFIGRDVHSNPLGKEDVTKVSHLNSVGKWLKENVASGGKGLYCTNCHNLGSRLLFKTDKLIDVLDQGRGETLRNKSIEEIVKEFRRIEGGKYKDYTVEDFFDPKVSPVDRVSDTWSDPPSHPYDKVDDAGDFWLAAGEPHCADCHKPPFVEGMGGTYFPIDMKEKYSLMRYSKGHSSISCQSCHESSHGLYPVNPQGPDPVSYMQAAQFNPDGSHGPLKCGACHVVDGEGVPTIVTDAHLKQFSDEEYLTRYEKAVALAHTLRISEERVVEEKR